MGIALDFFAGVMVSGAGISIPPKMEPDRLPPLSEPENGLVIVSENAPPNGVNEGASGRNLGPDDEKLKSLWGEKTGALTLILEVVDMLNWLEVADNGGGAWKRGFVCSKVGCGWNEFPPKTNCPGLKVLSGLNLNSGALTLSFEVEGLLAWLNRRAPD